MKKIVLATSSLLFLSFSVVAGTKAPENARVYFISPADGETVSSPFKVQFGLQGMGVAPAGVDKPNTGHHHLLVDSRLDDFKKPIAKDANHKHYGGGQTETMLDLAPGTHTLQLVVGDKAHVPFDKPVASDVITITVK